MALAPIPSEMLHDTAVFSVVTGMDRYQEKEYETFTVNKVHLQADNTAVKGSDNTEIRLSGVLFIDARKSTPIYDYYAMQNKSLENGDTMRVKVYGTNGTPIGDYAVLVVDGLPDVPANRTHHWELGLV